MSSAPTTGRIASSTGSKLTQEQMKHLLEFHLSVTIQEDTLIIALSPRCDKEPCTIPDRVLFFNCHRPPCPAIIVSPPPPPPPPPEQTKS